MDRRGRSFVAILFATAMFLCPAAAERGGLVIDISARCTADPPIPANLTIPDDDLRSLTTDIADRSPTFRNQLRRIADAPSLEAKLRFTWGLRYNLVLARTEIGRTRAGLLIADIQIPISLRFADAYVEFIAHEIEHVIEQVEGLNLSKLADKPNTGVYRGALGAGVGFETDRAKSVGRAVKREFEATTAIAPDLADATLSEAGSCTAEQYGEDTVHPE